MDAGEATGLMSTEAMERMKILSTSQAADLLARRPATLRRWASLGIGPIKPVRILGRLGWRAGDVAALLQVSR